MFFALMSGKPIRMPLTYYSGVLHRVPYYAAISWRTSVLVATGG
jgi:hypothetical protein